MNEVEYNRIYFTIIGIGCLGTDNAFEYLKQLATDED